MRLHERVRANRDLFLVVAIVAAAAAARFLTLGLQSFDSGETVTVSRILHPSYAATMRSVASIERSGPLYYTLAWGWTQLFGIGEAAIRSLSALFGIGTIIVIYLAAREVFSRRAALIAAALAAASPELFWYSQEARSYPLFIFFTATALYFFVRSLRRPSTGSYVGWAIASALALATHYFSVFSVAPEALWLVLAGRPRPVRPLVATGTVGLSGLALLPLAIHQEGNGRSNIFRTIPVVQRVGSGLVKFVVGEGESTSGKWTAMSPLARSVGVMALAGFAIAIVGVFARGDDDERRGAAMVGGIAAASLAIPVTMAYAGFDFIEPRNLLGTLVPLLIVVAAGADVWLRQLLRSTAWLRVAAPVALALPFAAFILVTETTPTLQRDNWRGLSEAVTDSGRAGVVLADPAAAGKPLNYYLHRVLPRLGHSRYPCGIRTKRIVTVTRSQPEVAKGPFRLASVRRMPQHWTVAAYVAPRPEWIDARRLEGLDLVHGTSAEARVDKARPARTEPRRRFAVGTHRSSSSLAFKRADPPRHRLVPGDCRTLPPIHKQIA